MSQIDKAFLSAYAKKRPSAASSTEVRPLTDPTGERQLKVHPAASNAATLQPHVPVPPTAAPAVRPTSNRAAEQITPARSSVSPTREQAPSFEPPATRAAPLAPPPRAAIPTAPAPSTPAPRVDAASADAASADVALTPRKTLTGYLQQARQATAAPSLPTRWSTTPPQSYHPQAVHPQPHAPQQPQQSIQQQAAPRPTTPRPTAPTGPAAQSANALHSSATAPNQHFRFDSLHTSNPPVTRAESTIPWSFDAVERSVKATADSKSVSARMTNAQPEAKQSSPSSNVESDHVTAPIYPPKERYQTAPVQQAETRRQAVPQSKSQNAENLAKITLPIQPTWEVDEFLWPTATARLLVTQAEAFYEIGLHLQHAQSKGLRVLSITSGERGVGRSTTAMCLAKTMSKLGMKIALFDGDYECPCLVDQLNLEAQYGWQQCLLENVPLDEIAIHAVDEAITFFPLTDSIAASQVDVHAARINKLIKRISNAYDMVIIDANRLTQKQSLLLGTGAEAVLDAVLLVVDAELSLRQRVDAAVDMVREQGVQSIGLVENFHS